METNKIIDAIREIVLEYVNEAKSKYLEARKLEKILEKHLQLEKPESECKCKWWRHCEVCRKADSCWAGIEKLELDLIHLWWHDVHKYKKIEKMPNGRLEEIDDLKICLLGMEEQFNKNFKKIADRINKQ